MRRLIADLYKILFKLTQSKAVSLFGAIGYITALNLLTIYGLVILTEEWLPDMMYPHAAFRFPYIVLLVPAMFAVNFYIMLPLHKLSEEVDIKPIKTPLVIYTIVSLLLFGYTILISS